MDGVKTCIILTHEVSRVFWKILTFVSMILTILVILAGIFQSVEFYIIATLLAAMTVALCARGDNRGPVREILVGGVITREDEADPGVEDGHRPEIEFICLEDGSVILRRRGIRGVTASGAVSLAMELKGFELKIRERTMAGRPDSEPIDTASFILDFMAREHYFISYTSDITDASTSLTTSLTLSNRPGNRVVKRLI